MKVDPRAAYAPPAFKKDRDEHILASVKAVAAGGPTETQCKIAMNFIINTLCQTHDLSYRPDGFGGERDTAFAEGKRFVGLMLCRMIEQPAEKLLG